MDALEAFGSLDRRGFCGGREEGGSVRLRANPGGAFVFTVRKGVDGGYPSGLTGVDLLRRPVPGHQFVDMGHFVICDACEEPAQPGFGIDTVHAAGFDERVGDCGRVAASL